MMAVREVLVRARRRAGMSQQQVVEQLLEQFGIAITSASYGHWESGRNDFKASLLPKLAVVLRFTEDDRCALFSHRPTAEQVA